jgi:methylated-DNA-[protein]-cysteine S-methyltransferase
MTAADRAGDVRIAPVLRAPRRDDRSMTMTTTPATQRSASSPESIDRLTVDSPIGLLTICGNDEAVTNVLLETPQPPGHRVPRTGPVTEAASQLAEYFAGRRREFDLPLVVDGTDFQTSVWLTLADIDYGETVSYAELARWIGHPKAFRAVGQANGANPIPVILPCHRVIAADGSIGGYGWGLPRKRFLLDLESDR